MIIKRKEHLSSTGLKEIISRRANLNLGISDELKAAFQRRRRRNSDS